MRKKCLAIAKKAMVWTLAASMLVATPLTASAAGLRGVYSVSDGTNNDIGHTGDESHTGTVTTTDTNTGVLDEYDAKIIGIVLDKTKVNAVKGEPETLKATVVFDGAVEEEVVKALNSKIKWEVQEADGTILPTTNKVLSLTVKADDRSVTTLNPRQGTAPGEDMKVVAKIDGRQTITFTKDGQEITKSFDGMADPYTASADVFIKEYSEGLSFANVPEVYVKHTLDMNDYLVRTPRTANDSIAWSSSDTKAATITNAGVVTFKKTTTEDNPVIITAVSEKGERADCSFVVEAGTAASRIVIVDAEGEAFKSNKTALDMSIDDLLSVDTRMYAKVKATVDNKVKSIEVENGDSYTDDKGSEKVMNITDTIQWTSSKPAVLAVAGTGDSVDLIPKAVGTAKITATTSSGKKATLSVTVSASITDFTIDQDGDEYYSGQSKQLTVTRWSGGTPIEANTDGLKWSIDRVPTDPDEPSSKLRANPNASINAKGVLTIKNKLDEKYPEITVRVTGKKSYAKDEAGKAIYPEGTATIDVLQSSIDGIEIRDGNTLIANLVMQSNGKFKSNDKISTTANTTKISVPKSRTYTVSTTGDGPETLKWAASGKAARVTEENGNKVTIKADAAGKSTITVSGIHVDDRGKASVVKTTFKVDVKQPTTELTLNKTAVVVKATGKKQSVSFSAKQNKNAKEAVVWSLKDADGNEVPSTVATITNRGKVELKQNGYNAGDVFTVTATAAESGVTATATIKVITASAGVRIIDPDTDPVATYSYFKKKSNGDRGSEVKNATVLAVGGKLVLTPQVNVGGTKVADQIWVSPREERDGKVAADVTYSVNKKGIVEIIDGTVYRVKAGSVTVTVKTDDGKSYKLKIDDAANAWVE